MAFQTAHTLPRNIQPTPADLHFVKDISMLVSSRAAAYVATAVHALWSLQRATTALSTPSDGGTTPLTSCQPPNDGFQSRQSHVTIACNGSIMEKYPDFRPRCQDYLNQLAILSGADGRAVTIEMALESSIFGAAVAAASEVVEETRI